MFLGIEIGGTKLQLGLGAGDGVIAGLWRGRVDPAEGGAGIRRQIAAAYPGLLAQSGVQASAVTACGVGFGGPTDDATQSVIKSHHVAGWDDFPLVRWVAESLGLPGVLCNDADVAGLAEALFGAGRGLSPVFYMTVGSGIGGGLIVDGAIYRGVGKGASEVGHLLVPSAEGPVILEAVASGWGIEARARRLGRTETVRELAVAGDATAERLLAEATAALGGAIRQVITLLCPRRVVIGGGVSLLGERLFFGPVRRAAFAEAFGAFAGLTDIVPAELGEAVVVHGALALAARRFGG